MSLSTQRSTVVRLVGLAAAMAWRTLDVRGRRRPVVLCYHGITVLQRLRFERQMLEVARRPGRVTVTFDDAFANLVDHALPVTTKLGVPVIVFAVSGNLGERPRWAMRPGHPERHEPTMTATQLHRASRLDGVRIGSHGATHRSLVGLSAEEVAGELESSRRMLEAITGRPVTDFAFPYGECTSAVIEAARHAGYEHAYTLGAQRDTVARYRVSPDTWPSEFRLTVDGGYGYLPWLRRLRDTVTRGSQWAKTRLAALRRGLRRTDIRTSGTARSLKADPPMRANRRTKVLAVASGGGHWVQLLRLRPAFVGSSVTWVTVSRSYQGDVGGDPFRVVNDATRWSKWRLALMALRIAWIIGRVRPDVVVTTGAAPGYFAVLFGRLLGARTSWIDSMANVDRMSMAGRKAKKWSDLWLSQWPVVAEAEGARYEGAVL